MFIILLSQDFLDKTNSHQSTLISAQSNVIWRTNVFLHQQLGHQYFIKEVASQYHMLHCDEMRLLRRGCITDARLHRAMCVEKMKSSRISTGLITWRAGATPINHLITAAARQHLRCRRRAGLAPRAADAWMMRDNEMRAVRHAYYEVMWQARRAHLSLSTWTSRGMHCVRPQMASGPISTGP